MIFRHFICIVFGIRRSDLCRSIFSGLVCKTIVGVPQFRQVFVTEVNGPVAITQTFNTKHFCFFAIIWFPQLFLEIQNLEQSYSTILNILRSVKILFPRNLIYLKYFTKNYKIRSFFFRKNIHTEIRVCLI